MLEALALGGWGVAGFTQGWVLSRLNFCGFEVISNGDIAEGFLLVYGFRVQSLWSCKS